MLRSRFNLKQMGEVNLKRLDPEQLLMLSEQLLHDVKELHERSP